MALYRDLKIGDMVKIWCDKAKPDPGPCLITLTGIQSDGSLNFRFECGENIRIQHIISQDSPILTDKEQKS